MAWRSGSLSRTLLATARSSSFRSSPPLPRLRPSPPLAAPRPRRNTRFSSSRPRSLGELGCTQLILPLHSVVAAARLTSHLSIAPRACCELSQGMVKMVDALEAQQSWHAEANRVAASAIVLEQKCVVRSSEMCAAAIA